MLSNLTAPRRVAASGPYATCLGVPANLENIIKSIKLGPNVKGCTFYADVACKKVKGRYEVYKKDQPDVKSSPILTLKCSKG
jgi:hypothetical protein